MTTDSTMQGTAAIDRKELRRCLTELYSRKESIHRLVSEAGLPLEHMQLDGSIADAWFAAVTEAFKGDQIEALVKLALDEHPTNKVLRAAHDALVKANAAPAAPVEAATPRPAVVASFDPRLSHFFVPFPPKGEAVIGRAEGLARVRKQLVEGRRTAIGQAASFAGLGGLGKTQLAVEYAHAHREDYPGGVYWFTADGDLDAQLARLAREARWVSPESESRYQLDIAIQEVRTRSNCLLVFDNVEHLDQIERLRPEPSATPHLLLTSRLPQPGFHPLTLDRLDGAQSLQMLVSESGRCLDDKSEDRAAAEKIAAQVDGLPLALELVGAYLRRYRDARWSEYAAQLATQGIQAHTLRVSLKHESFTAHEEGLHATLRIGERVLDETPMLRNVLDVLAWSGPASMGSSLLAATLAVEPVTLTEAFDVAVSMRVLRREDAQGDGGPRYQMHRLVREVRRLDVPFEAQHKRWSALPQRIGDWFEQRRAQFQELGSFEAEIDHLDAWQSHAQRMKLSREVVRLLWLRAYPSFHRGQRQQSQILILQALNTFRSAEVEDHSLLAHLLHDLGVTTRMAGDHRKALEYAQQALSIRRELLGERHPDTANSINNVGGSYGIRCNSPMAVSVARCWEPRRHAYPDGPPGPLQVPSHPDP